MKDRDNDRKYAGYEFEAVLRKLADTINRACILHCSNQEDAKDCFQNTFLKLYLTDKEFESIVHIKAWLLSVAFHECMNVYRHSWNTKVNLCDDVSEVMMQREALLQIAENAGDETLEVVLRLPLKYKRVIYLHYYEEYSVAEIASILSLSENTVKTQLARGRNKICEMINKKQNTSYQMKVI